MIDSSGLREEWDRRRASRHALMTLDRRMLRDIGLDRATAERWLEEFEGAGLDGVMAKTGADGVQLLATRDDLVQIVAAQLNGSPPPSLLARHR